VALFVISGDVSGTGRFLRQSLQRLPIVYRIQLLQLQHWKVQVLLLTVHEHRTAPSSNLTHPACIWVTLMLMQVVDKSRPPLVFRLAGAFELVVTQQQQRVQSGVNCFGECNR
jgi:hypothetical protein